MLYRFRGTDTVGLFGVDTALESLDRHEMSATGESVLPEISVPGRCFAR